MKADKKLKYIVQKNKISQKLNEGYENTEAKVYKRTKTLKTNIVFRILGTIIICLAFLFCIFNVKYLTPAKMKEHMSAVFANSGKGDGFPYRFSSNEVLNYFTFNSSDYVILTRNEVIILNKSAKPVLNYTHNMSNPIIKYSSDRILLYDQGSTKAVILNQSGVLINFNNDEKIICGDISNSGKSVLAFNTDNHKQIVNAYSHSGKKLMKWEKGSGYIVDTAINQGGNLLSVALIDTVDAVQTISVINFSVSNAEQKGHFELKESVFYDLSFINSNELALICNNSIAVLNSRCTLKKQCDLPSENNTQLFLDKNGHFVNVYSLYNNRNYQLDVYNSALKKIYEKSCQKEVSYVSSEADTLAVLYSDNSVDINTIRGKITYSVQLDNDFSFVLSKGKNIYACSSGLIEKVKAVKQ